MRKLTEQTLLEMPESDYMNEQQLAFFQERLMNMKQDIMGHESSTLAHLQETSLMSDITDQATQEEEYRLELRVQNRESKLLQKVNEALYLIETGEYGYSQLSGEPIGLQRLLIRPTATLTVIEQDKREKKQSLFV
jgi:DnaK suppressor protein